MGYDEIKKLLYLQDNSREVVDGVTTIINNEDSLFSIALLSYHLGAINAKRAERVRRSKMNDRGKVSEELADFMRLFYQTIEGKTDDMTVGDIYTAKNKYGLSNEETRLIFSL